MASPMSIENLQTTLKCLQNEKSCLEQKLRSMKTHKSTLQQQTMSLSSKAHHVSDMNSKMKETINVAKHKVEHTLQQQNAVQKFVDEKRLSQKEITEEIEREKDRGVKETQHFQEKLSALANIFLTSRRYYTPENLNNELKALGDEQGHLLNNMDKCEADLNSVVREMEQLSVDKESRLTKANALCFPASQQEAIIRDLEGCAKARQRSVDTFTNKQELMQQKLQDLKQREEAMKAKLAED